MDWLTSAAIWLDETPRLALATVIDTWGSAPCPVGSKMLIAPGLRFVGAVSGGCVESAVIARADEVIHSGSAKRLSFGVSDADAWDVGLACGGTLDVLLTPFDAQHLARYQQQRTLWIQLNEPQTGTYLDAPPTPDAPTVPGIVRHYQHTCFVDVIRPPLSLLIIGGTQIAVTLARLAQVMGYAVTLLDPRRAFASPERFPTVEHIICQWPQKAELSRLMHRGTAVIALTHNPKIDDPALIQALPGEAFYVGALGSTRTQAARQARLQQAGVASEALARLHAPIGLDIAADTPDEIAVAILAEVVQVYRQNQ